MNLFDLEVGELFIWDKQPTEIYRLIGEDDGKGRSITRCVAWKDSDGRWIFATRDSDENFNSYADIKRVDVKIELGG